MALAPLIPAFPLVAALVTFVFQKRLGPRAGYVAPGAALISLCLSVALAARVAGGARGELAYPWIPGLETGFLVDPLSAFMTVVVSGVSFLVTVYAVGYMREDPAAGRFFTFFSFFIAAMLGLVLAGDFLTLLIFWELVGVSSYALIGFWWRRPGAPPAAMKAFLMTRTMDFGLYLAVFLVFGAVGSLSVGAANEAAGNGFAGSALVATAVLLLAAALGKSAQFPTVTWLPDAMAGPTPVSALIHSATMVAAGVYLVARTFPLFEAAGMLWLVAFAGGFTALLSGLAAVWQADLKRALAASTSSQLGFMLLALGAGAPFAALFHLATHAAFKSLMFLGTGNIQEALETTDMRKMSGLRRAMPQTFAVFLTGALALAAVPPLSGFFSKETILAAAQEHGPWLYAAGLIGVLVTALYASRMILLPFAGDGTREGGERPIGMLAPAWVLAALTVILGLFGGPAAQFLRLKEPPLTWEASIPIAAVALGLAGAWVLWRRGELVNPRAFGLGALARPAGSFFGLDTVIGALVVRPALAISEGLARFDERVVDAGVELAGRAGIAVSRLQGAFDERGVDGIVRGVGALFVTGGRFFRRIQTGLIEQYLMMGLLSIVVLTAVLGIASL